MSGVRAALCQRTVQPLAAVRRGVMVGLVSNAQTPAQPARAFRSLFDVGLSTMERRSREIQELRQPLLFRENVLDVSVLPCVWPLPQWSMIISARAPEPTYTYAVSVLRRSHLDGSSGRRVQSAWQRHRAGSNHERVARAGEIVQPLTASALYGCYRDGGPRRLCSISVRCQLCNFRGPICFSPLPPRAPAVSRLPW